MNIADKTTKLHSPPGGSSSAGAGLGQARAAQAIASKGIPVFPCKLDKKPYTANGFKDATTSLERIAAWWKRWPKALIGVPTGKRSGIFVLDIDRLPAVAELAGALPRTRTVMSLSGGRHFYFKYVEGVRNSASEIAPDVDIR